MLRTLIVAASLVIACQAQAQTSRPDAPMNIETVPGSPLMGRPDPSVPAHKVVYHKCAPGAHWQVRKVWRDGKRVKVGHCVLNKY